YGLPPDVLEDVAPELPDDDTVPQPLYGLPPDAGKLDVEVTEDIVVGDVYGLPADVDVPDIATDIADEWIPQPEYGLPGTPDASGSSDTKDHDTADSDTDSELPPVTPLYGIPPQPE